MQVETPGSQTDVVCRGLTAPETPAYLEFAREAWGERSFRAQQSTLIWLYHENPHAIGMERDLLVVVAGGRVAGAVHRMRVPWCINGQQEVVPAAHDLFVLESHRGRKGERAVSPGRKLIQAYLGDERHVVMFGSSPAADRIYEKLSVPAVQVFWFYKLLSPWRAGLQKAFGWPVQTTHTLPNPVIADGDYQVTASLSPGDDEILEALTVRSAARSFPAYDLPSFRWRFFHKLGPKHVLVLARQRGELAGRAVLSIGLRRGLVVGCIVDLLSGEDSCLSLLVAGCERVARQMDACVAFAVTGSQNVLQALHAHGWKPRKNFIGARWYSKPGEPRPQDIWISGGAWDYGWDEPIGETH